MTDDTNDNYDDRFASRYIDLLSERVGGRAIACSDQWFAECDNLVKPGRGVFKQGLFVATGQWMDGWESRRSFGRDSRTGDDFDWCILRLGIKGILRGFDIDTNHFRGNAPEFVAVEAANVIGEVNADTQWTELLPKSPSQAHSQNLYHCDNNSQWTHLRLKMFPDGGIARFRAYGEARIARHHFIEGELIDLASVVNGGRGIDASDRFYSSPSNLVMPGRGINMGDGWETKRRRDRSNDWALIELGVAGTIRKVVVDTAHFKGNFPDRMSLQATSVEPGQQPDESTEWQSIISECPLYADREHLFIEQIEVDAMTEFTHVRINIYPDGGISRLRVFGFPNWQRLS